MTKESKNSLGNYIIIDTKLYVYQSDKVIYLRRDFHF